MYVSKTCVIKINHVLKSLVVIKKIVSCVGVRQGENLSPILFFECSNTFLSHCFNILDQVSNLVHQTTNTQS